MSINESQAIKVYNDTKKGYWGRNKMMKKYREMLNKVYALQRHKEVTSKHRKKLYKREGAIRPLFSVQVDLADFPKLENPKNNNIRYLMICVDVFSMFMWVLPLKSKENLHIPLTTIFKGMKEEFNKTPENMTGDNEFDTNELKRMAEEYKFRWWYGDPNEKYRTGIVERAIRRLRGLIKRYLTQNDTTKYIHVIQDLVENYNNTEHSHIHTRPQVAIRTVQTFPRRDTRKKVEDLRVGDWVRILEPRKRVFDKGDKPYYSKDVYEIIKKNVNKYHVRNLRTGENSEKTYYIHQLLKVDENIIKDKRGDTEPDNVGYDRGIEHKEKQKRNKRALRDVDQDKMIEAYEGERQDLERDLHYDDEDFFHDKPLPENMSDKQLEKKQHELENKVDKPESDIQEGDMVNIIKPISEGTYKKNKPAKVIRIARHKDGKYYYMLEQDGKRIMRKLSVGGTAPYMFLRKEIEKVKVRTTRERKEAQRYGYNDKKADVEKVACVVKKSKKLTDVARRKAQQKQRGELPPAPPPPPEPKQQEEVRVEVQVSQSIKPVANTRPKRNRKKTQRYGYNDRSARAEKIAGVVKKTKKLNKIKNKRKKK